MPKQSKRGGSSKFSQKLRSKKLEFETKKKDKGIGQSLKPSLNQKYRRIMEHSNLKGTLTVDTQPTICMPFLKTGRCPFGDACIYAHVRDRVVSSADLSRRERIIQKELDEIKDAHSCTRPESSILRSSSSSSSASSSSSSSSKIYKPQDLQPDSHICPICKSLVQEPVSGDCGHVFCFECLQEGCHGSSSVKCRLCSSLIEMPTIRFLADKDLWSPTLKSEGDSHDSSPVKKRE
ncbi:Pre-mRNA-splicing factor CWC24-like protein [Aduncisulcus paluster]|uniref:Pre-mRNA-splicing factor CWC24-like protein n=1 Tax=Aduncisulcus paluster TaxID=2918883 RepID=A0ABQ5K966_9EUKA|nr:Pre-mRNA-splicing factor CWC24-like protein [Aduncisulcus paluster]